MISSSKQQAGIEITEAADVIDIDALMQLGKPLARVSDVGAAALIHTSMRAANGSPHWRKQAA
jgi:hypothetical protein